MENKENRSKPTNFFIGLLLEVLLFVGVFNLGFIGNLINGLFSFLFGTFAEYFIVYLMICTIFFMSLKLHKIFKDRLFHALSLVYFNIYFIYSIYFFASKDILEGVTYFNITTTIEQAGPGNIGLWINKVGFFLFDMFGSIFLCVVIFVVALYLLNVKYNFMSHILVRFSEKRRQDKKYKDALNELNTKTEDLEYTQTLVDTSSIYLKEIEKENNLFDLKEEENKEHKTVRPNETMALEMFDELFNKNELPKDIKVQSEVPKKSKKASSNTSFPKNVGRYNLPTVDNLSSSKNTKEIYEKQLNEAKQKGDLLVDTLESFKLNVKILDIVIGPSVTKYELQPEPGVKVSRFNSLANDIALSLAAQDVRIEAPIPGKSAIGIEVPNSQVMMVNMKEIFSSKDNNFNDKLQVALGKDIDGNAKFLDITKTPHLLVAGATGSGKSVCINTIITSILLKASPEEVKMVMIDPKKVELTPYNDIPHLELPVVTDPKRASVVLNKMVSEMEYRYELFAQTNTRNINGYNDKIEKEDDINYKKLPYIVVIVDELADLMMVASNEVEAAITRIAQMARAAGIHLILATQRPSADVITGLIKSNIPTRIAFSVSSGIDSRTILDKMGAEKLLGKGDMLLSTSTSPKLDRIQGAFLSDDEINSIVNDVTSQFSGEQIKEFRNEDLSEEALDSFEEISELDELYEDVKKDVIEMQKASASFIQKKYKVGYNRASDILLQLEQNNIISPNEGPKPRRVLVENE